MVHAPPWGICDRCGEKRRRPEIRKEWSGANCCPDCYDPKPPQLRRPRIVPEGVPLRNALPPPPPVYRLNPLGLAFVKEGGRQAVEDGQAVAVVVNPDAGHAPAIDALFAAADLKGSPDND